MKFKNSEILSIAERDLILQEVRIRCVEYEVFERNLSFKMNKELRTSTGYIGYSYETSVYPMECLKHSRRKNPRTHAEINISVDFYKEFGFEAVMGVLRHHLAHYIAAYKYGSQGYDLNFYIICKALGGNLNERVL